MDPGKTERQSTVKSGIALVLLLAAVIAVAVVIALNPAVLESIAMVVIVVLLFIAVVAVLIAIFAGLITIPMYMKKGVEVQTGYSYDLDDVKEVEGSMENKKD